MSQTSLLRYIQRLASAGGECSQSDAELLERFVRDGSEQAFEMLVRRHGRLVWGVCRRVLYRDQDAEDAFQATFVVLANKAARIRHPEMLASWLFGVARRIALKARARAKSNQPLDDKTAAGGEQDVLSTISARELLDILDEELARLPDRYRTPLLLCCLEGKTRDEAAKLLGWSIGSVKGRLERGRQLLEQRLTRRGIALSAALAAVLVSQSAAVGGVPAAVVSAAVQVGLAKVAVAPGVAALSQFALRGLLWESIRVWVYAGAAACLMIVGLGVGYALQAGGSNSTVPPEPMPVVAPPRDPVHAKEERPMDTPPAPQDVPLAKKQEYIVIEGTFRSFDAKANTIAFAKDGDAFEGSTQILALAREVEIRIPIGLGRMSDVTRTKNSRVQLRLTAEPREVVGITVLPRKKAPSEKGKG